MLVMTSILEIFFSLVLFSATSYIGIRGNTQKPLSKIWISSIAIGCTLVSLVTILIHQSTQSTISLEGRSTFNQSTTLFQENPQESSNDSESLAKKAEALREEGKLSESIQAFENALSKGTLTARQYANFAQALADNQKGSFAGRPLELLHLAIQTDSNEPKAIALMGAAQYQLGNHTQATRYIQRLLDILPSTSPSAKSLRILLKKIQDEGKTKSSKTTKGQ